MKLYRKKLNSVEELKREQLRLKFIRLQSNAGDLMPIKELGLGRKRKSSKGSRNLLGMAFEVMNSKSTMDTVIKLAIPALTMILGKKKGQQQAHAEMQHKPRKGFFRKALTGIIVTFLIGKGVQMGMKALKAYSRSRKQHKLRLRQEESDRNRGW
jgi:hypothetical protein